MSKRVLIGLWAVSILVMWGNTANAFNRIRGIIIRHGSIQADITLCGDPQQETALTLVLVGEVEIACANPGGHVPNGKPGHPTFLFTFEESREVTSGDFTTEMTCDSGNNNNATATINFTFDLPSDVKCKPKWTKVPGSELISVAATATWSCTGTGPECQSEGDTTIEAIHVECADIPPSDEEDEGVPCNSIAEHVGPEGPPPPPLTAVAYYDFQAWVADPDHDEQGFNNSMPFTNTVNGLTLTTTAFESDEYGSTPSHVYMDGLSSGIIGGMGVCSHLDYDDQCIPSSDDSVSIDGEGDKVEILHWDFSHNITQVTLELGNGNHFDYDSGAFRYQYGSQGWKTATTDENGEITLIFDGSSAQLEFKAVAGANSESEFFYIRNADITYTQ